MVAATRRKEREVEIKEMVEMFQCPGCVCGSDTNCGHYNYDQRELKCTGHVIGTHIGLGNRVALGLPKGFNKPGFTTDRLCLKDTHPGWDRLNVPVWAMEKDGFLFIRTFAPRINFSCVDVIEGGTLDMVPNAINVAEFYEEID